MQIHVDEAVVLSRSPANDQLSRCRLGGCASTYLADSFSEASVEHLVAWCGLRGYGGYRALEEFVKVE